MKKVDFVHWTADPIFHGIIYDLTSKPLVGELRDVSEHKEAGCNIARITSCSFIEDIRQSEDCEDLAKHISFWYVVLQPMPDQPCDENFMAKISS